MQGHVTPGLTYPRVRVRVRLRVRVRVRLRVRVRVRLRVQESGYMQRQALFSLEHKG